ncbi:hypothetical protein AGLY_003906 [Aphis glycines]|uniref:Uncharacterized protein n=1 Tax=Aphis glycines TaxID=307491 RepID=A0A6G0TXG4_APHGL|nr:hypothetical protein AGLY_003906 [Aphis glycines]
MSINISTLIVYLFTCDKKNNTSSDTVFKTTNNQYLYSLSDSKAKAADICCSKNDFEHNSLIPSVSLKSKFDLYLEEYACMTLNGYLPLVLFKPLSSPLSPIIIQHFALIENIYDLPVVNVMIDVPFSVSIHFCTFTEHILVYICSKQKENFVSCIISILHLSFSTTTLSVHKFEIANFLFCIVVSLKLGRTSDEISLSSTLLNLIFLVENKFEINVTGSGLFLDSPLLGDTCKTDVGVLLEDENGKTFISSALSGVGGIKMGVIRLRPSDVRVSICFFKIGGKGLITFGGGLNCYYDVLKFHRMNKHTGLNHLLTKTNLTQDLEINFQAQQLVFLILFAKLKHWYLSSQQHIDTYDDSSYRLFSPLLNY